MFAAFLLSLFLLVSTLPTAAQAGYQVVSIADSGTISGTVKWFGPPPRAILLPINKDAEVCDPDSAKKRDLERLVIGPDGGVANTVVFLKNVSRGKAMDLPEARRRIDQRHCRYEPHILLVPAKADLQMKSSDAVLHTIHMQGAATYNLPFPFPDKLVSRTMPTSGLVDVRCNGGHVWMNAEILVVDHPYYAVTDESGRFELAGVPPGEYLIEAWHEGWNLTRNEAAYDVLTERRVQRPVFTEPKVWDKKVTIAPRQTIVVNFVLPN